MMPMKLLILIITVIMLAALTPASAQTPLHIGIERNFDYHHDESGAKIHSKNIFSMIVTNSWGLGIGGYWESKRVPFIIMYGDPGDGRSSGLMVVVPITRIFMDSKFNAQITNKVKLFGNDIGKAGIWRYWVPSLQIDYYLTDNIGIMTKLTREFNCNSGSIGIQFRLNNE